MRRLVIAALLATTLPFPVSGQGPGSRLLVGTPPPRPTPAPRVTEAAVAKAREVKSCDALRGGERGRCLLEARQAAESSRSAGSGTTSGSVGAGAGGTTPR